jgi:hypothetical protein
MENEEFNYKKDLKIDRYNLDLEWAKNPELFAKWSEKLVDVENHRDRLKDRLDLKMANLDTLIRTDPTTYGLPTDPKERSVHATIIKHPEYRELQEQYLTAKYQAKILRVAVRSFQNREKAIDRETKLYLAQYYMKSYGREKEELVQSDGKAEVDQTAQATASLNAHMKFRKR